MNEKRKISVRKMVQAAVTILVTGACITAVLSAARMQDVQKLQGYDIVIKNDRYSFVDKEDIKQMLVASSKVSLDHISMGNLNAHKLEGIVKANPWVSGAQVYVGNDKMVHVNVIQRVPVARLFDQAGHSYYLDNALNEMPLSDKYVHYTTVVTNVPVLNNDSMSKALKGQVVAVVNRVERDSFWRAQVSQIIVTDDRAFELVPVLGNHRILIGDTTMLNDKFNNLFAFYKKVLNRIGWDKYEVLDVRYKGQVVASPAIAWKVPVDKAVSNMNWVKSIIGDDQPDAAAADRVTPAATPAVATVSAASAPVVTPVPKPAAATPAVTKQAENKPAANVKPATAPPVVSKPVEAKPKPAVAIAKPVASKPKPSAPQPKQQKPLPAAKTQPKKQASSIKHPESSIKHQEHPESSNKEEQKPKYLYQGH